MTPEDLKSVGWRITLDYRSRFTSLLRNGSELAAKIDAAIAEEREACATDAEARCIGVHGAECRPCEIAAAIRARGNP